MVLFHTTGHNGPFAQQAFRGCTGLKQTDFEQAQSRFFAKTLEIQILPYRAFFSATKIVEP